MSSNGNKLIGGGLLNRINARKILAKDIALYSEEKVENEVSRYLDENK